MVEEGEGVDGVVGEGVGAGDGECPGRVLAGCRAAAVPRGRGRVELTSEQ